MAPTVDAIIPVYSESSENLARTVESLVRQERAPDRIVVVDDASPTPVALPNGIRSSVELLRLGTNGGVANARNMAAAGSRADYLLFVNCEVALRPSWIKSAMLFMHSQESIGAVGGPIVPQVGPRILRNWRLRFLENPEQRAHERREVSWLTGHALLVSRRHFEDVGGFDTSYRAEEDHDLAVRLRADGHSIYHLPDLTSDSYERASIDLFARKLLRLNGWTLRADAGDAADVHPVRLVPATVSVLRALTINAGRNLYKGRFQFLPVDVAVAGRSLFLVWAYVLRRLSKRGS
jgi:GT2 family glycosyltransferase